MITLSCDDACASDMRFAELASKYNVPTVFYWPVEWHSLAHDMGYKPLSYWDASEIEGEDLFEIGAHTITHRHLTKLPIEEAKYEIELSKGMLEMLLNPDLLNITKFAPPRGYTNGELTEFTLGIYEEQRLTRGKNLVHIHPDSGANENMPWQQRITKDSELWCHSWELDKYNLWSELEEVLRETVHS